MLVSPGVYKEAVTVTTNGHRDPRARPSRTILDGEFTRDNGVKVLGADGVAVENMTARNYTTNGFFWTGVHGLPRLVPHRDPQRRLRHLRVRLTYGQFDHDYASGSPDAGFYIGQCFPATR